MQYYSNLGILWFHDHSLAFFCIILLAGELAMDISFTHSLRANTSNHISEAKFSHMTLSNFKGSKARSFCHMFRKWDLLNICPKNAIIKLAFFLKWILSNTTHVYSLKSCCILDLSFVSYEHIYMQYLCCAYITLLACPQAELGLSATIKIVVLVEYLAHSSSLSQQNRIVT